MNRLALHCLAGAALLAGAAAAFAGPTTLTHHGFTPAGSVNVKVGATNTGSTVSAAAGAFSVTWDGKAFVTYCVELTQYAQVNQSHPYQLSSGVDYFGTNFSPALNVNGSIVVERLGRLFTALDGTSVPGVYVHNGVSYSAAQTSAAIQLAVWELVYEGPGPDTAMAGPSLLDGYFREKTSSPGTNVQNARALADAFIGMAAAVTEITYSIDVLWNGTQNPNNGFQDYLLVRPLPPGGGPASVPVPGTLALTAAALVGWAGSRRRRARA